jgi:DNA-3-methyladenine glycosylase
MCVNPKNSTDACDESAVADLVDIRDLGEPLPRSFYARCAIDVAPDLLNCILISASPQGITAGRISETEAYTQDDAAAHTFRGRTPRNQVMFGLAGHAYVYFTYGMHYCLNAVTGREGQGEAVLFRAIEPLYGMELMAIRRGLFVEQARLQERHRFARFLGGGPAKLCKSLGVDVKQGGLDLTLGSDLWISAPTSVPGLSPDAVGTIISTPRIGITRAVDLPRRYTVDSDRFTSR